MGAKNKILLTSIIMAGCITMKPEDSLFRFDYKDTLAIIMCKQKSEYFNEPHNILLVPSRNVTAIDYDRDMVLDNVVSGDFNMETAQLFYDAGLGFARERGAIKEEESIRTYKYKKGNDIYTVVTTITPRETTNKFSVLSPYETYSGKDVNSDGSLDSINNAVSNNQNLQKMYEFTLKQGIFNELIEKIDGRYLVKPTK